jgi:hypothetical protein
MRASCQVDDQDEPIVLNAVTRPLKNQLPGHAVSVMSPVQYVSHLPGPYHQLFRQALFPH